MDRPGGQPRRPADQRRHRDRPRGADGAAHALGTLDALLAESPYLLGQRLTLADVRLWVTLVRLGPALREYPALSRWTRGLLERDAFRTTTDLPLVAA